MVMVCDRLLTDEFVVNFPVGALLENALKSFLCIGGLYGKNKNYQNK
jgi:hypothetical protein